MLRKGLPLILYSGFMEIEFPLIDENLSVLSLNSSLEQQELGWNTSQMRICEEECHTEVR